ncbi:MAG: HesA/MoeB/ThiF family protein [Pseudomonadota bacterium]
MIGRYNRHELLKMIGPEGQTRIRKARVFVAGVGALGSLISMLLARAGVGFLRIADLDTPEIHNLHRQLLYDEADVTGGASKVVAARNHLLASNSEIEIDAVAQAIGPDNIEALTDGVDLVVDALDNIRTRYHVNDAVIRRGVPYVFGGAVEAAGNVMTIIPGRTPCLRCLWPDPDAVKNHPTAAQVGVLSSAASAVASFQVTEALKVIVGREDEILEGLLVMDLWRGTFYNVPVARDPSCVCAACPTDPADETERVAAAGR